MSGSFDAAMPPLHLRKVPWSNPVGADLRAAQQAELDARSGGRSHDPAPPTEQDHEVFFIAFARSNGQPLGCGGLRRVDSTTAEVKRLYVLPYARGSRVATAILSALEAHAWQAGYRTVTAEAGSAQPDGKRFYAAAGYQVVPTAGAYAGVEGSVCYAKEIGSAMAAVLPHPPTLQ